jgi:uncharacterized membrane protein YkvA (DUF1232 family)
MELPDFMNYASKFSQKEFAEKIARIAKRAGAKLVYSALILYYTLQSDKVSKADKAIIIGALGYMISPLDVIPDAIPIAGLTDDLAVLLYVLKKVWTGIDPQIVALAKEKLTKWFDEDEIIDAIDIFKGEEE